MHKRTLWPEWREGNSLWVWVGHSLEFKARCEKNSNVQSSQWNRILISAGNTTLAKMDAVKTGQLGHHTANMAHLHSKLSYWVCCMSAQCSWLVHRSLVPSCSFDLLHSIDSLMLFTSENAQGKWWNEKQHQCSFWSPLILTSAAVRCIMLS